MLRRVRWSARRRVGPTKVAAVGALTAHPPRLVGAAALELGSCQSARHPPRRPPWAAG